MPVEMLARAQTTPSDAPESVRTKRDIRHTPRTLRFYGDEFVFDTVSGMFYVVSATASFIFRALDAGTPLDQLADKMQRRYGITRVQAVRDIERLFDDIAAIEPLKLARA